MKIVFFINTLGSGGAERAVSGLANHWVDKHDITIITFVKMTPFYKVDSKITLKYCLEQPKTYDNVFQSTKDGILRFKKLHSHLKIIKPDVVLSFMITANVYAIWACKWLKIPSIVSERANHAIDLLPQRHVQIRNVSYRHAARLVVQTRGNAEYYATWLTPGKIMIVPNAVANDLKAKRLVSKNSPKKTILNVGSFKDGKAQDTLIRAFARLPEHNWRLVFLGKGPNLEKFKALAKQLGVADRIFFDGAQKDVASYYNNATMFVFTSEHEGFPNALLEALYFGLPSISTNCPHGPADMISNGNNGFLVPIGDEVVLGKKMELLMKDEILRQTFSQNALESTKKYEMEHIAAQWIQVIDEVIKKRV